ncbi:MAG: energy transducer TonB [Mucilaginibacter sp.]|uniref:energy transducer TonB n=1 Tax=Mucilaginibacter sp. TaxID=1882438 RepID=UPI003263D977
MKYSLPVLFILLPLSVMSQKLKKVSSDNPRSTIKEIYEVLKSDTAIKQGSYKKHQWGRLITEGYYKNNKKDSIWQEYGYAGKLSSKRYYKDGVAVGVWEFYEWNDNIDKYNMPGNTWIDHKPAVADTLKSAIINGSDTLYAVLDHPAVYVPGDRRQQLLLVRAIRYPAKAKENNTMGKVLIAVTVAEHGHATNYRIKKNVKNGLGEEALRVALMMDDDWLPGMLNGKPVRSEYVFPISFALAE